MFDLQILQNIWLTEIEAKLYNCLLEKWTQNISKISEFSWLNRVQIYKSIPHLIEKNLIGQTIKGKRKLFFAENPENLENIFEEKKFQFQNTLKIMKEKYNKKANTPWLKTFHTRNGLKIIFDDVVKTLKKWELYYRYSSRKENYMKWFLGENYTNVRDKKEIQRLVITSDELMKLKEKKSKKLNREIRAIPKKYDLFEDNISKVIYANKVAIIDYNTDTSFIVENKKFAEFEKKIFKLLFKFLKKR